MRCVAMKQKTDMPKMAPLKSEPPGMERDGRGNAIPLKERTQDDKDKAKRARAKKSK